MERLSAFPTQVVILASFFENCKGNFYFISPVLHIFRTTMEK